MEEFQFQKCCNQNDYFLLINSVMKKLFLLTHFCITKPVDKKEKFLIFSELAPPPIQSSSGNILYKKEALKPL